jgi:hypothetical protein
MSGQADKILKGIGEDLQKLGKKILMLIAVWLILVVVCVIILFVSIFVLKGQTGTFIATKETFSQNGVIVLQKSVYQEFEFMLLGTPSKYVASISGKCPSGASETSTGTCAVSPQGGVREILHDLRHNIIFSLEFRTLAIIVAVLATALMGFSMLSGDQEITIKEFAMDILIIFGTTGLILSPEVEKFIDFFYGIITASADWIMDLTTNALFKVVNIQYANGSNAYVEGNIYAPIDVVAGMFFDSEIGERVRIKLLGLLFAGYIHYVPVIGICMIFALLATLNVFLAFMMAKITILFALQCVPFFILFAAINDVKVKFTKKGQSKSFLWALIEVGIIKPWLYLALMSFLAGFLFYALVVQNIANILNFPVKLEQMKLFGVTVPLIGDLLDILLGLKKLVVYGLNHDDISKNLGLLIIGLIIFKKAFTTLTELINNLAFSGGENHLTNLFSGSGGIYDDKNAIGSLVNPVVDSVQSNALKYTTGYNSDKSDFSYTDKSLLGGFRSQRNEIKKFFTMGEGLENKKISKILGNKDMSQEDKVEAVKKILKQDSVLQDDMRNYFGTKSDKNKMGLYEYAKQGLMSEDTGQWKGKDLDITDKHYDAYAKMLVGDETPTKIEETPKQTLEESVQDAFLDITNGLQSEGENAKDDAWQVEQEKADAEQKEKADWLKKQKNKANVDLDPKAPKNQW